MDRIMMCFVWICATLLYSTVPASRMTSLHGTNNLPKPILQYIGDVTDCITMREEIPSTGAISVVVQPGAENEVGEDGEEDTEGSQSMSGAIADRVGIIEAVPSNEEVIP